MKVNRELILQAALELLNEVGSEELTLRRLALKLKIQAPTLYWHFKSKEDLTDAMATLILAEGASQMLPDTPESGWKVWVSIFGHGLRKVLLKYRDGARVVAGSRLTDTQYLEITERIGARLVEAGFSLRQAVVLLSSVYTLTVSFVVEEQAVFPLPGQRSPKYDIEARKAALDAAKFPLHRETGEILFDEFDRRYQESLALLIDGASLNMP